MSMLARRTSLEGEATKAMSDYLLNRYVLIMAGGAFGSVCRYMVQGWAQNVVSGTFPLGTLIVNVVGCFLIGVLNMLFTGPLPIRPEVRIGILVGVLGGFTTFSSFGWETFALGNEGQSLAAVTNVVLSLTLGLAAVWCGYRLAERLYGV
jgi:fluoride exporter